ncbi:hypothetical protein VKT23_012604 [Stygiomarasmius scandens]|uniref:DUF659 domain-containing protein n=1 Tax=Marasmiellus scandens TaxID=2682957 RepID=A0ABR1J6R2_9AGAR
MIAHILGGQKPCKYASKEAQDTAKQMRRKEQSKVAKRAADEDSGDEGDKEPKSTEPKPSKKRKVLDKVETHQTKLKVFKGINIPFTEEQKQVIHAQFLRASVSAKLPLLWTEDPEVIKLFMMFRSMACDVIPSQKVLANRLLLEEYERIEKELKEELEGKSVTLTCDGVKDISKNSLVSVDVSADYKSYMVDLYDSTADKKDGDSMCKAFEKMIDTTEKVYGCEVVALGTDNDGGSRAGRVKLEKRCPWIFTFPCGAHQGQLVLGDYFKECSESATTAEEGTDLIGWINNHSCVRSIFDDSQQSEYSKILKYIVGNLTRWTTHEVSFKRLEEVKQPLRSAAVTKRQLIIDAQVGKESVKSKADALRTDAITHLDLIEDNDFWRRLAVVISDIKPISYATNICQSDHARPDSVLLAFVGMFIHFRNLPATRTSLSKAMTKRLERQWSGLNQPLMITAMILNPYEHLDRFGPNAAANILNIHKLILDMFSKSIDRPISQFLDDDQKQNVIEDRIHRREQFSTAFLHYCAHTGPFKEWSNLWAQFSSIHGDDPVKFWQAMGTDGHVAELANFSIKILTILRKDHLRNRLGLKKLEMMIKIGAQIRFHHYASGLREVRKARNNHSDERVSQLLAVPRYAALLQEEGDSEDVNLQRSRGSFLINNRKKWRAQHDKWIKEARHFDELSGNDTDPPPLPEEPTHAWLPRSLELLFGGKTTMGSELDMSDNQSRQTRRKVPSEEQLLMELLAQEEEERIPDEGELEGSGDEYDGH